MARWLAEGRDGSALYDATTSPGYNDGHNENTAILAPIFATSTTTLAATTRAQLAPRGAVRAAQLLRMADRHNDVHPRGCVQGGGGH